MSKQHERPFYIWPLLVALLILILDQVSKFFVVRFLGPEAARHSIPLVGSLRLIYVENTGISFGQLQGHSIWITIFGMIAAVGLTLAYRYMLTTSCWANLAVGLILGGAWGNRADRLLTGWREGMNNAYVVDFVDTGFWPIFNVADSAITVGGIIYAICLLIYQSRSQEAGVKEP